MRVIALLLLLLLVTACTKVSLGEIPAIKAIEKETNNSIKSTIEKIDDAIPDYETPGSVKEDVIEESEVDSFGNAI
jgi:hypothetical protein